jgi:cytochrome c-type biogenesis protein CcmH/NrfG
LREDSARYRGKERIVTDKTRKSRGKAIVITLVVLVLLGVGAVGGLALLGRKDAQGYLADAQAQLAKGNLSAAVIQFRNAVQRDPNNAAARYQLASVLLRTGDAVSAEKEI